MTMAWDSKRPYAAFDFDGNMITVGHNVTPTKDDIDYLYEYKRNALPIPWPKNWAGSGNDIGMWLQFKDVPLTLTFVDADTGRKSETTYLWRDEKGHIYFMFQSEFLQLLRDGMLAPVIKGRWSAVKRGSCYGIELVGDGDD